jgi:hypothetical protein
MLLVTLLYACSDSVTGATLPDALGAALLDDATGAADDGTDTR